MRNLKTWPHLTVVFVVFAALGVGAAALWMRHEPKAEALALPAAARVERVDGEVGLNRGFVADDSAADAQWIEVTPNTPLTTGDRLYAREDSQAGLAFTGRNFARLDPDSALDVVSLTDRRTQLALRDGSAIFNIGELQPGELFEVATPYGAVDFREPGLYQMGYNDDGSAFVSVLSGLAQVVGLAGSGQVSKGEMLTLLGQTAAQIALSRLSPDYAGGLVDDYYGYQYPDAYDGRYSDYDAYLNDPYYYDPYNRHQSYRYVPSSIPGAYDLDYYGDWQDLSGYGHAWSPRVEDGWAPYQQGYWMMDDPYGLTWVSNEPWGYAPYHYGRWANVNDRWYWVPESANAQPAYAPALVAFLPPTQGDAVGWVPLAPGDPYTTAYYDANWQPHYYGDQTPVIQQQVVNLNVPGAVTVVPFDDFDRDFDPRSVARFDRERLNGARPVVDPLSHAMLRQAALQTATERRGFVLPPGLAKRLDDTQVFTSARPVAPRFKGGRERAMRVEAVPERQRRERLQFRDERQSAAVAPPVFASRVGGEDRRAARELRRQERARGRDARAAERAGRRQIVMPSLPSQAGAEMAARRAEQQLQRQQRQQQQRAEGERVGLMRQAQKQEAERQRAAQQQQQRAAWEQQRAGQQRQQREAWQQQRRAAAAQQVEARRQQAAQQRAQQQAAAQQRGAAQRAQQQRAQQQLERARAHQQQQAVQASRGQMRKQQQQAPAPQGQARPAGPPKADKSPGRGGGKGKGRP